MDYSIQIFIILVLILAIYLLYFWVNSEVLSEDELNELSNSQRFWEIQKYFNFITTQFSVNKDFKSSLNKKGQFYNCNETISNFPGIASALLKGKKHEWIIFAFAKDKNIFSFYSNKGDDNQSVSPSISSDIIKEVALENNFDTVLQFHNHPNAVLSASEQDLISAEYFGKTLTENKINYISFVCGAGLFYQYGWWMTESFYNPNKYLNNFRKENGISRKRNFELRKDLKRKKNYKDFRLNNNSSHNLIFYSKANISQQIPSQNQIKLSNKKQYLQKVLTVFTEELEDYPKPHPIRIEKMKNMGDNQHETWDKLFYNLSNKEFGIFNNLVLIVHSDTHRTFIFSTDTFSLINLEYLVSIFYPIFGNDAIGKGKFDNEDQNQVVTKNFWNGRMWTDYEKYNCAVSIYINAKNPKLDLVIKW